MKRVPTRRLAMGAVLFAAVCLLGAGSVPVLTRWLLAAGSAPDAPADLIVVLDGGARERVSTALDLYLAGFAPAILLTDRDGFPDAHFRHLEAGGVPDRALLGPPSPSSSTWGDALTVRQIIEKHNIRSILVVTSPYHCRRAALILGRVLEGRGVCVHVTPSRSLYFDPQRWWTNRNGRATVPWEFPKLLWAWLVVPRGGAGKHPSS